MQAIVTRPNPIQYIEHTSLAHFKRNGWADTRLPKFIRENNGAPGNILHFGDPDRTGYLKGIRNQDVAKEMKGLLEEAVIIDDLLDKRGRAPVIFGLFPYKYTTSKGQDGELVVPIMGVAPGMGEPTTLIILQDVLAHVSMNSEYVVYGQRLNQTEINLERIGSCGGVNSRNSEGQQGQMLGRPDLVIPAGNLSTGGTIMEFLGYPPSILGKPKDHPGRREFEMVWKGLNGGIVEVGDWTFLENRNSPELIKTIDESSKRLGIQVINVPYTLSKQAIELEQVAELIQALFRKGVRIAEMESAVAASIVEYVKKQHMETFAKYGIGIYAAMIALVIGSLPGTGYPEPGNKLHEAEVKQGVINALRVGLVTHAKRVLKQQGIVEAQK